MTRHLLHVLAAASFVLAMASAALWVRSYFTGDKLTYAWAVLPEARQVFLPAYTNQGLLSLSRYDVRFGGLLPPGFLGDASADLQWERFMPFAQSSGDRPYLLGFGASDASRTKMLFDPPGVQQIERWRIVTMPLWALTIAFGVLPGIAFARHRRRRLRAFRAARGWCETCGYDLQATPDRCPECGRPRSTTSAPSASSNSAPSENAAFDAPFSASPVNQRNRR